MVRYASPKQEHGEVICEVVAVVGEQVIRLQDLRNLVVRRIGCENQPRRYISL